MSPWQMWMAIQHDPKTNTLFILGQRTVLLIKVYKRFFQRSNQSPHQFMEIDFENAKDFYHRIVESTDDGIPVSGWNSRSTWRSRGDGLLSVHEGKAFMINESMALILDLNVDTPALHVGDLDEVSRPFESRLDGQSHEAAEPNVVTDDEVAPSILVYTEWDPPCACQYQFCNFVQMDDVGLSCSASVRPEKIPLSWQDEGQAMEWAKTVSREGLILLLHYDFSEARRKFVPRPQDPWPDTLPGIAGIDWELIDDDEGT